MKKQSSITIKKIKKNIRRPGRHSKKQSNNKRSKLYSKPYNRQGK